MKWLTKWMNEAGRGRVRIVSVDREKEIDLV